MSKKNSPGYTDKYNAEHYEQVLFRIKAGGKEAIRSLAEEGGESLASYITRLVREDAERRGKVLDI